MEHRLRLRQMVSVFAPVAAVAVIGCGSESPSASTLFGPGAVTPGNGNGTHPPPPGRPTTKAECDACDGIWGVHGAVPEESCICPTVDGGQACVDGNQCEGQCLLDEGAHFQVMADTTPPRGFYTGYCSHYDTTFGCHWLIPPGIEGELPVPREIAAEHLCID